MTQCKVFIIQHTRHNMLPKTYNLQRKTCTVQLTKSSIGYTTIYPTQNKRYNGQHTNNRPNTLNNILHSAYNVQDRIYIMQYT